MIFLWYTTISVLYIGSDFKIEVIFTTINGTRMGEISVNIETVDGIPVGMLTPLHSPIFYWHSHAHVLRVPLS